MKQDPDTITGVKNIAERLKQARKDAGLTQPALAKLAGVSPGTIGNIEAGTRTNVHGLLEIARAVKVNAEWLKTGKGPKSAEPKLGAEMNGWPLSPELLAALQNASPEMREIAESQARVLLKMKQRPESSQETDEGAA